MWECQQWESWDRIEDDCTITNNEIPATMPDNSRGKSEHEERVLSPQKRWASQILGGMKGYSAISNDTTHYSLTKWCYVDTKSS